MELIGLLLRINYIFLLNKNTMIIINKNIDNIKCYPFDENWKKEMINFCNFIYNLYLFHYKYQVSSSISSHFVFIYRNICQNPYNSAVLSHIKILAKQIYNNLSLDYDFSVVDKEIDDSYLKFLDLFEITDVNMYYEYLTLEHIMNGYILGNFLNINPILCCFLNPYVSNYTNLSKYLLMKSSKIHYLLHDSFGFLKVNYDIGPGYNYLYIGDHKHQYRYEHTSGKLLLFFWKNNFLLKL